LFGVDAVMHGGRLTAAWSSFDAMGDAIPTSAASAPKPMTADVGKSICEAIFARRPNRLRRNAAFERWRAVRAEPV